MDRRPIKVDVLAPSALSASERGLWAHFRAGSPRLASPYFDLRFVLAAAEVCPGAALAVIHRGGRIEGFLPFQRRGGLVQPLAAPLADYHGIVARPGARIDLVEVIRALGGSRMRFSALASEAAPAGAVARQAMQANLEGGFDAYLDSRSRNFLKDKRRRRAALERDHAPVSFQFGSDDPGALGVIINRKREQFARTHQFDVFSCGWTERLLRRLAEERDPDFGVRTAVLRTGEDFAAAEIGLLSGDQYHLWFPVYEASLSRYSPGALMTLDTLAAVADLGVTRVDFGPGGEAYKADFAEPGGTVFEGAVLANPIRAAVDAVSTGLDLRHKLERRLDRIAACEPQLPGRMRAGAEFLGVMVERHPGVAMGLGIGLSAGLGLALLAD